MNNLNLIKGLKLSARAVRSHEIKNNSMTPDSAKLFFIIENLGRQLNGVITRANKHQHLSYSSRIEDVEKGVAVGISVTERVLPLVNEKALAKIHLKFSPLFMRIAKKVK